MLLHDTCSFMNSVHFLIACHLSITVLHLPFQITDMLLHIFLWCNCLCTKTFHQEGYRLLGQSGRQSLTAQSGLWIQLVQFFSGTHNGSRSGMMHWNFYEDSSVGRYSMHIYTSEVRQDIAGTNVQKCSYDFAHAAHYRAYVCLYVQWRTSKRKTSVNVRYQQVPMSHWVSGWVACAVMCVSCVRGLLMCGHVTSWITFAWYLCALRECLTVECIYCTLPSQLEWVLHKEQTTCGGSGGGLEAERDTGLQLRDVNY